MTLSVVRTKLGCVVDTVIEEVPVTVMYPLTAVAVIVAYPDEAPVTNPVLLLTVATPLLLDENVIVAPLKTFPFWSLAVAVN